MKFIFKKVFMPIGERLREERERMGLSQPKFALLASTTKQTLFSWESGKTAPDGFQLSAIAAAGADVLYIVTGLRSQPVSATAELPPRQRALLNSYELCNADAQRQLDQLAALLAAGLPIHSKPASKSSVRVRADGGNAAGRDMTINSTREGKKRE